MRGDEDTRAFVPALLSAAIVDIVGRVEPDAAVSVLAVASALTRSDPPLLARNDPPSGIRSRA